MISELETRGSSVFALSRISGKPKARVTECLRYNVIAPQQLSYITGFSIYYIESRIREGKLTAAFPFQTDKPGPKFILRDKKFEDFIETTIFKHGK
jgi:hypothetical protein